MPETNYEFHITGGRSQVLHLNSWGEEGFFQGTLILAVDNLDSNGLSIRKDWMTCFRARLRGGHSSALHQLFNLQQDLGFYQYTTLAPHRVKIEVEYQPDLDPEDYIYAETHYHVSEEEAARIKVGISRNLFSGKLIATERCYDQKGFTRFAEAHSHRKVELCLLDSDVSLDSEGKWLKIPKNSGRVLSEGSWKSLSNVYGKLFKNRHNQSKRWEVH